jgi:hypothetical protein
MADLIPGEYIYDQEGEPICVIINPEKRVASQFFRSERENEEKFERMRKKSEDAAKSKQLLSSWDINFGNKETI